jgi:septal ring factor EnvC (AmiA/AmiB activator)
MQDLRTSHGRRARAWASATGLALAAALGLFVPHAVSAGQDVVDVESTRDTLDRWMQTRGLIGREKADWVLGRQVLEERAAVLEREIAELRAKTEEARKGISDAETKRDELEAQREGLAEASQVLAGRIAGFEQRTLNFLARCPEPVRERVRLFSQRIPLDPAQAQGSLSERYQFMIATLNEINRFQREVTVTSEVRELPEGGSAEVTVLYAGLGQAWYVGADGEIAGVGRRGPSGWTWTAAPQAAASIARAVAILKNEEIAAFVQLPLDVGQGGAR